MWTVVMTSRTGILQRGPGAANQMRRGTMRSLHFAMQCVARQDAR